MTDTDTTDTDEPKPTFQDEYLNDDAVCNNCYSIRRRTDGGHEWRNPETTTVSRGPADSVSAQIGTWCDCGVESAFHQVWSEREIGRDKFRKFIKQAIRTAEKKGHDVDRHAFAAHALDTFDNYEESVNEALAEGFAASLEEEAD